MPKIPAKISMTMIKIQTTKASIFAIFEIGSWRSNWKKRGKNITIWASIYNLEGVMQVELYRGENPNKGCKHVICSFYFKILFDDGSFSFLFTGSLFLKFLFLSWIPFMGGKERLVHGIEEE